MKNIFFILTITSCIFSCRMEAAQPKNRKVIRNATRMVASPYERKILIDNCYVIKSNIAEKFAGMGALNSSGYKLAVKQGITNYLNSVGTQTAMQLLQEYQANGFRDFI